MEETAPAPSRRENLRRTIMARRQARGRLSPVKVEQNWNRRSELTTAEMEKKERRREQNRRAAQRCRTKKRLTQFNVIKNLERIVEHNRHLQKEVQQLRWDKGELHRKWNAHRKLCPHFLSNPDQADLDKYESSVAIKTEPISDEEDGDPSLIKTLAGEEGQENDMDFSLASMASVLCSSPIAGFPKNFLGMGDLSDISDESLNASMCGGVIPCSPSTLEAMDTSFLLDVNSSSKSKKDNSVSPRSGERRSRVPSSRQLFVQTSRKSTSATTQINNFHPQGNIINTSPGSTNIINTTSTTQNKNSSSTCQDAQSMWQFVPSSSHRPQKCSPHRSPPSCMFDGQDPSQSAIPQAREYTPPPSCHHLEQQQQQQHPVLHNAQHQGFPLSHSLPPEQNVGFHYSATFSSAANANPATCASPVRQRCASTSGPQTPKSAQYPDLCRLLQPHPSPAQVVPSISTNTGDGFSGNTPTAVTLAIGDVKNNLSTALAEPESGQQLSFCNRSRAFLASCGSTPDSVRTARRDSDRARCNSDSSDGSVHSINPTGSEAFISGTLRDSRSTETPDADNDDVFAGSTDVRFTYDTNNNSALVSNNNTTTHAGSSNNTSSASLSDVMLFGSDISSDTSSVLESVRHLIDSSDFANGNTSCSNTPSSISSNSSMRSEVDDLLFEIPCDALLFFRANNELEAPHDVFAESL